jgi:F-type H+-transporting ATPase subunit epsilon
MATINLEIITAERKIFSDTVSVVVAPGADGELGILPDHAPLLTTLQPGELKIIKEGEESFIAISGGFIEVLGDKVIVLADTAERSEEIDVGRAEKALQRANELVNEAKSDIDLERAVASLRRSHARLRVANRKNRATRMSS